MKTFEVTIQAWRVVIVKAENAEAAEQIASEECTDLKWNTESWKAEESSNVPAAIRHGATKLEEW